MEINGLGQEKDKGGDPIFKTNSWKKGFIYTKESSMSV